VLGSYVSLGIDGEVVREHTVGIYQEQGHYCVQNPAVQSLDIDDIEEDEERQRPDLADHGYQAEFLEGLAEVRDAQHHDDWWCQAFTRMRRIRGSAYCVRPSPGYSAGWPGTS
jgi:hypothetical protein